MARPHRYVICVKNRGYSAALDVRKVYRVLSDSRAEERALIRVIDESGEDYLYPNNFFVQIDLSRPVETAILRAASRLNQWPNYVGANGPRASTELSAISASSSISRRRSDSNIQLAAKNAKVAKIPDRQGRV